VALTGDSGDAQGFWWINLREGKRPLGKPRGRWKGKKVNMDGRGWTGLI
jgi:hypothetical protein